jgi:hypothetical protein
MKGQAEVGSAKEFAFCRISIGGCVLVVGLVGGRAGWRFSLAYRRVDLIGATNVK